MYNRFNQRRGGRPSYGRGGGFGGPRRIKTFDPTVLINTPIVPVNVQEYKVTHAFSDFKASDQLIRNVLFKGYKTPTPIQDQAIPPILEGRDLIGIADTGTGKTAAFLIPLIDKVLKNRQEKVLIIAPTHELASQIRDEFLAFSLGLNLYSALCIGGTNMRRQVDALRRGANFVIGTPGRLMDLIDSRYLDLSNFSSVVLDEADLMVDMGFIHDMRAIISLLPHTRQSLFFSATIDEKVREILQNFVKNPITVSVKTGITAQNIVQRVVNVPDRAKKVDQLHELLISEGFEKVLVFGRTKFGVQRLSDELIDRGFKADSIHGNKKQNQRIRTLQKFKSNEIQILIATDVAARGLDIPNVSHVINYDLPESHDTYIHRIGRTGRADKKGVALTFIG